MFCGVQRLQDDGVDDSVADEGGEGQPHGQRVDPGVQHQHAQPAQHARQRNDLQIADGAAGGTAPARCAACAHRFPVRSGSSRQRRRRPAARCPRCPPPPCPGRAGRDGQEHAYDGAKHGKLGNARLGQHQVLSENSLRWGGNSSHAGILAPDSRTTGAPESVTLARTRPAAPPLCNTAINKGHWKKMVVRPVSNWASSKPSTSRAGPRKPGSAAFSRPATQVGKHQEGEVAVYPMDGGQGVLGNHFARRQHRPIRGSANSRHRSPWAAPTGRGTWESPCRPARHSWC